jgi:hypothetical protein
MQLVLRWGRLKGVTDSNELRTQLISGILRDRVHHGLLWQAKSKALVQITLSQWSADKECPSPSWSWASYSGAITWEMHLRSTPIPQDHRELLGIRSDPVPKSLLKVSAANVDKIVLSDARLVTARAGKSFATEDYDAHTYALEIGVRTCSQGRNMKHWSRMLALVHPTSGEIIGRGTFDADTPSDSVDCLLMSDNPIKTNPHTFTETESSNVLLIRETPQGYIRLGVGELSVRSGSDRVNHDINVIDHLMLI